jgi:hypothetical protein
MDDSRFLRVTVNRTPIEHNAFNDYLPIFLDVGIQVHAVKEIVLIGCGRIVRTDYAVSPARPLTLFQFHP